ncbi:MAG TPA: SAM-dependent methyltransferase [Streptosporangiaceae bacterium]
MAGEQGQRAAEQEPQAAMDERRAAGQGKTADQYKAAGQDKTVPKVDATKPHPARIYDYWLGGKDNFAVDRELAQVMIDAYPGVIGGVRTQRAFLGRAVRYLVREAGIRQFLDIGTGLPAADNTHEVAQRAAPESRIVYVDNDPMVLAHARALLVGTKQGATAYIDADLRDVETILYEAEATLDFSKPIGIVLLGVMQFVDDLERPQAIIDALTRATVPGSYLVLGQPAKDVSEAAAEAASRLLAQMGKGPGGIRARAEILRFFDGLEMIDPGLVQLPHWRPDPGDEPFTEPVPFWAGVARKL